MALILSDNCIVEKVWSSQSMHPNRVNRRGSVSPFLPENGQHIQR